MIWCRSPSAAVVVWNPLGTNRLSTVPPAESAANLVNAAGTLPWQSPTLSAANSSRFVRRLVRRCLSYARRSKKEQPVPTTPLRNLSLTVSPDPIRCEHGVGQAFAHTSVHLMSDRSAPCCASHTVQDRSAKFTAGKFCCHNGTSIGRRPRGP